MRRLWSGAAAAAILTASVALVYRDLLFRGLILGDYDAFVYFYPLRQYAAEALQQGRFPLWNPDLFLGAPFFANVQTAVLYPLNLLFLWLPTPFAYTASVGIHLLLAGGAMYLLATRSLRVGLLPGLLAAITFTLSGFMTGQIGHINQLTVAAWMPLLLVTFDEAVRRRSPALGIATGLIGTLQLLAGHTQEWYFSTVTLGLFALWRIVSPAPGSTRVPAPIRGGEEPRGAAIPPPSGIGPSDAIAVVHGSPPTLEAPDPAREVNAETALPAKPGVPPAVSRKRDRWWDAVLWPAALLAMAGLVEVGLTAVQLLPSMELSGQSLRGGGMSFWEAASFSLPPTTALYSILPTYPAQLFSEYVGYVGIVPLVLAGLAVATWWRRPVTLFLTALAALGLFMALGKYNPVYSYLFHWIPGLDFFRVPARWLLVYTFGVSGLAGLGAQVALDLGARASRVPLPGLRRRLMALLQFLLGVLILGAAVLLLGLLYRLADPTPTRAQLEVWGLLAGVTLALVALGRLGRRAGWVSLALLLAVTGGELWVAGEMTSVRHPIPFEAYRPERSSTNYLLGDAARWSMPGRLLSFATDGYEVKETPDYQREYQGKIHPDALVQFMINVKLSEVLAANVPTEYGIQTVDGYDGGILPLKRYGELKSLLLPQPEIPAEIPLRINLLDGAPPQRLLDLLNVRYLLAAKIQDAQIDGIYYDRSISAILAPGETRRLSRFPPATATSLGIISSTEGARERKDGEVAAELTVTDLSGLTTTLPVRLGVETGETPERDATSVPPAHRKPPLVDGWSPEEKATEYFGKLALPIPMQLREIRIKSLLPDAKFRLRAISLIDDRSHDGIPLVLSDQWDRHLFFDMKLYTNRSPLPRVFMVHQTVIRGDDNALSVLAQPQLALDTTALLSPSPTARAISQASTGLSGGSEARLRSYAPEEVVVDVSSGQSGYLMLLDAFYPGWRAEVDGADAPIERADYFFRAVYLEAGQHQVVFRYQPESFRTGMEVTLASLGLVGMTLLYLSVQQLRRRNSMV